jgi:hypothetical protein
MGTLEINESPLIRLDFRTEPVVHVILEQTWLETHAQITLRQFSVFHNIHEYNEVFFLL